MIDRECVDKIGNIAVQLVTALVVLFLVVPIILAMPMAFDPKTIPTSFIPSGFTTIWFERLFTVRIFVNGLITSVTLASVSTAVSILCAIFTSIFIVRHDFKGKELLQTFMISPLMICGVVTGAALVTTFYQYLRSYNSLINLFVAHLLITLPYSLRLISGALVGFDRSLEEAAESLGASEIQTYFKITIPLIKPNIIAAGIFSFITSWDNVAISAFLTDAYTITFPVALFSYMRTVFDPSIAASSVLLMSITLALLIVLETQAGMEKFIGTAF